MGKPPDATGLCPLNTHVRDVFIHVSYSTGAVLFGVLPETDPETKPWVQVCHC